MRTGWKARAMLMAACLLLGTAPPADAQGRGRTLLSCSIFELEFFLRVQRNAVAFYTREGVELPRCPVSCYSEDAPAAACPPQVDDYCFDAVLQPQAIKIWVAGEPGQPNMQYDIDRTTGVFRSWYAGRGSHADGECKIVTDFPNRRF